MSCAETRLERRPDRQCRQDAGEADAHQRLPASVAHELDEHSRGEQDGPDAELRLDHRGERRQDSGGRPAAAPRRDQRGEQRKRPDGVDLSPVRTGEDRAGMERPETRGERRAPPAAVTPREHRRADRDRDVGRDARGLHRETQQLAVEERAEEPEDVEIARRVVDEIVGRVEGARPDPDHLLGPRLEGADVARETG